MNHEHYLEIFNNAAGRVDKAKLANNHLELKVATWFNSVVLKIQKASWCNNSGMGPTFMDGIFFSIWISDELINQSKIAYNIHALKLRELKGYNIKSRDFAENFHAKFKEFERDWPNVNTDFGPQTLMEGWVDVDLNHFEHVIVGLCYQFIGMQFIIDEFLEERKM